MTQPADEKPPLKDASTNPWYVLMTVAGPQDGEHIDEALHARNRRYFNGWMAQALSAEEKQKLIEDGRAKAEDLADLTPEEAAMIGHALAERCGADVSLSPSQSNVNLSDAEVAAELFCTGFVFPASAFFEGTTFRADATFDGTTFRAFANFRGTTFRAWADFQRTTFREVAKFEGTTFREVANFQGTTFRKVANFVGTTFCDAAVFEGTTFCDAAVFRGTTFLNWAIFEGTTFRKVAGFQGTTFCDLADFQGTAFRDWANFQGTTFCAGADFKDARFKSSTNFSPSEKHGEVPRPVRFLSTPPQFFNADLHEDTDFTDVQWPLPEKDHEAGPFIRAYEKLKLIMGGQSRVHDQLMFQQLELRCREIQDGSFSLARWGSRLFRWTSDYGWSLGKPLWWLAILIGTGGVVIWGDEGVSDSTPLELDTALGVSFSNVFSFLGVGRRFLADEYENLTLLSEVVSTFQMIAGPFLLFLFGVALRNRFRIK